MRRLLVTILSAVAVLALGMMMVFGQDTEKSAFIQYVEETISSPSYQIKLNGLEGTLSSEVSLESITIADEEGVWLTIERPNLVWTRTALLTGQLLINKLEAEKITFARKPVVDESLPAPESGGFSIPQLPVAVALENLDLREVEFGREVFDLESRASVAGKINIGSDAMDVDLEINRLDGNGGQLKAIASYENSSRVVALDIALEEPRDGMIAAALDIKGRPPVSLGIKGEAPISELLVTLAFDVDRNRILEGTAQFSETETGIDSEVKLGGPLSEVLPSSTKALFGPHSALTARMLFANDGSFELANATLKSGVFDAKADAATTSDGFLRALNLNLQLAADDRSIIKIPLEEGDASIASALVEVRFDARNNEDWFGNLSINRIQTRGISIETARLETIGTVTNFQDPSRRSISFASSGGVSGLEADDPAVAEAIGAEIVASTKGEWKSGSPLKLVQGNVSGSTFNLDAVGDVSGSTFEGTILLQADNLEAFSAITDRKLGGSIKVQTEGKLTPLSGGFDVAVDGTASSLMIGNERVDALLVGETILTGDISRTREGLGFHQFKVSNAQMESTVDGNLSSKNANIDAKGFVRDIAVVDERSSGEVQITLGLNGKQQPFDLVSEIQMPSGRLAGQFVDGVGVSFRGTTQGSDIMGTLSSSGQLSGQALEIAGEIETSGERIRVSNFEAGIGKTNINGEFTRQTNGLIDSEFDIDSNDISSLAALFLREASGRISGKVRLTPEVDRTQSVNFELSAKNVVYEDIRISSAELNGKGTDILVSPKLDAAVDAQGVTASGIAARTISGRIKTTGRKSNFDLTSELVQNEARLEATGEVDQNGAETKIVLQKLQLRSNVSNASLVSPSVVTVRGETISVGETDISVGNGRIRISGDAGQKLNLAATLTQLPLNIANSIDPSLGTGGTVSGTINMTGTSANPKVDFDVDGRNVSVRQTAEAGLDPFSTSVSGSYFAGTAQLDKISLRNTQKLDISGSGNIPLKGNGLALRLDGNMPLSALTPLVAERGTSFQGLANISIAVSGSLENPATSGRVLVRDGTVVDPLSNLRLANVNSEIVLSGNDVATVKMQARFAGGGSVAGNGTIGLSGRLPANIAVQLASARYGDGETFSTVISGNLVLQGELAGAPILSGDLNLARTEITVPESFASDVSLLDVQHVSPSSSTSQTLSRVERATPKSRSGAQGGTLFLDIGVSAPNQIFVRGRGLDAELGGRIRVIGPVSGISPQGRFTLRRGRLSLLGQRLDLQEGSVTVTGDLDPTLDFLASTTSDEIRAFVRLQGRASDLRVSFSSNPELPEDEVLARIIFGRGVADLSPTQIARLAAIASELTGGNSPSLVDGLRKNTGLDDIDVVQDQDGNAAVKAGKYVSDNVYLGVQAGQETEATINLDITDSLRARGSVNSQGESTIGIFFEKDY